MLHGNSFTSISTSLTNVLQWPWTQQCSSLDHKMKSLPLHTANTPAVCEVYFSHRAPGTGQVLRCDRSYFHQVGTFRWSLGDGQSQHAVPQSLHTIGTHWLRNTASTRPYISHNYSQKHWMSTHVTHRCTQYTHTSCLSFSSFSMIAIPFRKHPTASSPSVSCPRYMYFE